MYGIDISHWQGNINWKNVSKDKKRFEFAFMKCTESTNFLDSKFSKNKQEAREAGMLVGYYHFARGGDYKKEADWFLENVGDLKEGELIALDYEINTLKDPATWCNNWLSYVESKVGFKPLLYTYHSLIKSYNWELVAKNNFGLWVARYGLQEQIPNQKYYPAINGWDFFAIWQFCSRGKVDGIEGNVDLNYTGMDLKTLKLYGKRETQETTYEENLRAIYYAVKELLGRGDGDLDSNETKEIIKELKKLSNK
jgi:lysozyme